MYDPSQFSLFVQIVHHENQMPRILLCKLVTVHVAFVLITAVTRVLVFWLPSQLRRFVRFHAVVG